MVIMQFPIVKVGIVKLVFLACLVTVLLKIVVVTLGELVLPPTQM